MPPLVEVRHLVKHFTRGGGLFRHKTVVRAVDDVSFTIDEGETFALVGESGSGKSTTGRCMLRLVEPTSGQFLFRGEDVLSFSSARLRAARREMQMVFQDPFSSLNPRMRAFTIVEEPLVIHKIGSKTERRERVAELFRLVGLEPAHLDRYPHEFSGGQRQRIGLARALALNPSFIIADEPVSALDVSIQAQVINLLMDLQEQLKLTYLFVAHDLQAGPAHLQPGGRDVPRQDRRDGADSAHLRAAAASLHAGTAVGRAGDRSGHAEDAHRAGPGARQPRRAAARGGAGAFGGGVGVPEFSVRLMIGGSSRHRIARVSGRGVSRSGRGQRPELQERRRGGIASAPCRVRREQAPLRPAC